MKKYLLLTILFSFLIYSNLSSLEDDNIENRIVDNLKTVSLKKHDENFDKILNHFNIKLNDKDLIYSKLKRVGDTLNVNPEWILKAICRESRANPKAINPYSNATGIIQWLPSTAIDLGTTVNQIYNMSFNEQLDLVVKYFKYMDKIYKNQILNNINSYEELYLTIFYPKAIGKSDCYIIGKHNSKVVKYNSIMANNGVITIADFKNYARVTI